MSGDSRLYWLIRSDEDEVIGITILSWPYVAVQEGVYKALGEAIGHRNWKLNPITKIEFETYKEFGFEEFKI